MLYPTCNIKKKKDFYWLKGACICLFEKVFIILHKLNSTLIRKRIRKDIYHTINYVPLFHQPFQTLLQVFELKLNHRVLLFFLPCMPLRLSNYWTINKDIHDTKGEGVTYPPVIKLSKSWSSTWILIVFTLNTFALLTISLCVVMIGWTVFPMVKYAYTHIS